MALKSLSSRAVVGYLLNRIDVPETSWVPNITNFLTSDQASETYADIGSAPVMTKRNGGRKVAALREMGFTIKNDHFEATLEVMMDDIRRDKTGKIQMKIDQLAERANQHDAQMLTPLIVAGASSLCYDGQYFFDTDHQEGDSPAQSNAITSSATTPAAMTAAEAETAILKATEQILSLKDDRGEPTNASAKRFMVMGSINQMRALSAALGTSVILEGGQSRNSLIPAMGSVNGFSYELVINPRLTTTTKMFLFRADGVAKPLIRQVEKDNWLSFQAEGSPEEYLNDRHLYSVDRIAGFGYGDWKGSLQVTLQ